MRLAVKGPTTENIIEEVKQATTQSIVEVAMIQVELGDLHNKIKTPVD